MKYSFEQFKVQIENPTVEVVSVNDNITNKTCTAHVKLTTDTAEFGVDFSGFTYVDTWEDADIVSFVNSELANHAV